ncbi:MAG: AI-2E family transporter [Parvibaculales bacterium]
MTNSITRVVNLYLLLALAVFLLYSLSDILLPFVAGFAIAYLLDPVADRLESFGLNRIAATAVITFVFMVSIILLVMFGLPYIANQLMEFVTQIPAYVERLKGLSEGLVQDEQIEKIIQSFSENAVTTVSGLGQQLLLKSLSFLNILALLVITPVVTFYMLNDWDKMVARLDRLLPPENASRIRQLAGEVDNVLTGFVHGQILVCLFLGLLYAIGLELIGLDGGFIIGFVAGLISFIPYLGSMVGVLLATVFGLFQYWPEWQVLVYILLVFGLGQFIEGNILTPKLVGEKVRLHPVWIMFALLAFGSLFGFLGLLLAVPVAAIIGVIVRNAIGVYENKIGVSADETD